MEYESTFLKLVTKYMLLAGMWPINSTNYAYTIYHHASLGYYIIFVVTLLATAKDVSDATPEKQALVLQNCFTYGFLLWKTILCQQESIREFIKIISRKELLITNSNDTGLKNVYEKCLKHNTKIFNLVLLCASVATTIFMIMTYFEVKSWPTSDGTSNSTVCRELRLPIVVPFDVEKYFELVFGFQVFARMYASIFFLVSDALLNSLVYFPAAYLKVLGYKFEHFADKIGPIRSEVVLRELILEHKEMIEYVIRLNATLKWFLSVDFFLRSYYISFALMGVISLIENPEFNADFIMTFSFSLAYLIFIVFLEMCCSYYNCNELIIESMEIGNNIFHSNWREQSLAVKRSLSIVLMRSQKPLEMRIGSLYVISNDLIVGFAKAGFTYILLSRLDFQNA